MAIPVAAHRENGGTSPSRGRKFFSLGPMGSVNALTLPGMGGRRPTTRAGLTGGRTRGGQPRSLPGEHSPTIFFTVVPTLYNGCSPAQTIWPHRGRLGP